MREMDSGGSVIPKPSAVTSPSSSQVPPSHFPGQIPPAWSPLASKHGVRCPGTGVAPLPWGHHAVTLGRCWAAAGTRCPTHPMADRWRERGQKQERRRRCGAGACGSGGGQSSAPAPPLPPEPFSSRLLGWGEAAAQALPFPAYAHASPTSPRTGDFPPAHAGGGSRCQGTLLRRHRRLGTRSATRTEHGLCVHVAPRVKGFHQPESEITRELQDAPRGAVAGGAAAPPQSVLPSSG